MNSTNSQKVTKGFLRCGLASLTAMLVLAAAPALADPITFDSMLPSTNESGTSISAGAYNMAFIEGAYAASFGAVSGVGVVLDPTDPNACEITGCPGGTTGNYLGIFNDGAVKLTRSGPMSYFSLDGFDFAFITPTPQGPGDYGRLQLTGTLAGGGEVSATLAFPGQNQQGRFTFGAAAFDPVFLNNVFSSLTINACVFLDGVNCVNSLDNPAWNQAQFGLDNIVLNDVPEPASFLLLGIGAAALGLSRRRAVRNARASLYA